MIQVTLNLQDQEELRLLRRFINSAATQKQEQADRERDLILQPARYREAQLLWRVYGELYSKGIPHE